VSGTGYPPVASIGVPVSLGGLVSFGGLVSDGGDESLEGAESIEGAGASPAGESSIGACPPSGYAPSAAGSALFALFVHVPGLSDPDDVGVAPKQ
jgi:hypothetical protein